MHRATSTALATSALVLGTAVGAGAAPPGREVFTLECDDGVSYEVAVHGNGLFTPGRLLEGRGAIIPASIGDFTFSALLPDETIITGEEPGYDLKGRGNVDARNPRVVLTCEFSADFTLTEAEDGFPAGTVLSVSGTVTGFRAGRG
ncbi:MAG: hypothetical protein H5T80_08760 [Dietzia sp.]|nr:hypothetical protein [Dietzia sp.]